MGTSRADEGGEGGKAEAAKCSGEQAQRGGTSGSGSGSVARGLDGHHCAGGWHQWELVGGGVLHANDLAFTRRNPRQRGAAQQLEGRLIAMGVPVEPHRSGSQSCTPIAQNELKSLFHEALSTWPIVGS